MKHIKRVRVEKACDTCRVKKTKCNGLNPCQRCSSLNIICLYTERNSTRDKKIQAEQITLLENKVRVLTDSLLKLTILVKLNESKILDQFASSVDFNAHKPNKILINDIVNLLNEVNIDPAESTNEVNQANDALKIDDNVHNNILDFDPDYGFAFPFNDIDFCSDLFTINFPE